MPRITLTAEEQQELGYRNPGDEVEVDENDYDALRMKKLEEVNDGDLDGLKAFYEKYPDSQTLAQRGFEEKTNEQKQRDKATRRPKTPEEMRKFSAGFDALPEGDVDAVTAYLDQHGMLADELPNGDVGGYSEDHDRIAN